MIVCCQLLIYKQLELYLSTKLTQTIVLDGIMETSSTENNCIHLSKDDIATFENFKWWIDSVAERTIGLSGIFANCLAIAVLTRKRMTSNFNLLLVCLAIFDIFFIIFSLAEEIEKSLSSSVHFNNVWNLIFYPCYHISMTASIYMTVNLSFERYRALVAKPLVAKLFVAKPGRFFPTNSRQTKWVLINVISVVIFSVAFNIPKFYELEFETQYQSDNSTDFQLVFSNLYHDYYFVLFYDNIVRNIVLVVIPFASLTFFNVRIYCLLKNRSNIQTGRHQSNEKQAYVVLLGVVLVLAVCHALRMFLVINLLIRLSSNNVQERYLIS